MPVRVAVVGAGYLGRHHARVFSELEGAELVGVVDIDAERAGEVAGKYGVRPFTDYRDVLNMADAVSIAVPTTLHYEVAIESLRAGKDILVEKPITATSDEAEELIIEAEKRGRILQVGHLERYNPGVIALSEMIGEPVFFEATRVSPFLNRCADVDVTLDLMIHDIDVILGLVRSPVGNIRATGFSFVTEKIDEARAWIEFENGVTAFLTAGRTAQYKLRKLGVFGKDSFMELDYQKAEIRRCYRPGRGPASYTERGRLMNVDCESLPGYAMDTVRTRHTEPLKSELDDFLRCVITRERPKVSGIEGRDALKVALEINSLILR